jgi:holin-like protein
MLYYLTVILCFQLAGELIAQASGILVPGPVIGMVLLFCFLLVRGSIPNGLTRVAEELLANLSLLFVPAGVGVMLHFGLLGNDWAPIGIALIVSTVLTIAVTALTMTWLNRATRKRATPSSKDGD